MGAVAPARDGVTEGHRACAAVVAAKRDGRTRCTTIRSEPPLTFRQTPTGLMWVGTTAGPIGGDDLQLSVHVEPGADLVIGSAGASIVLPGPTGAESHFLIDVVVGERASLIWRPEPAVLAAGAIHRAVTTIEVGANADLIWVEELVLGRHAEQPGVLSSRLVVDGPDGPVLRTGIEIGADGWDGPAVMDGRRALGQMLLIGAPAERWSMMHREFAVDWMATTELAGGAQLINVITPGAGAMRAAFERVLGRLDHRSSVVSTDA